VEGRKRENVDAVRVAGKTLKKMSSGGSGNLKALGGRSSSISD